LSDVSNRREPDIADPEWTSQLADSAPTTFALGRTEVRAKAVIPSQGRRDLDEVRKGGPLRPDLAGVCRIAASPHGRRDGRGAHLRPAASFASAVRFQTVTSWPT